MPLKRSATIFVFLSWNFLLMGETFLAFVSENSAPALVSGAQSFHQQHPEHQLIIRTPSQLAKLQDIEIKNLLNLSHATLIAGFYGEQTERLKKILQESSLSRAKLLLAISSDRRLVLLSSFKKQNLFQGFPIEDLKSLYENPGKNVDFHAWLQSIKNKFPDQAPWLQARAYWQSGGTENLKGLMEWMLHFSEPSISITTLRPQESIQSLYKGKIRPLSEIKLKKDAKITAILDLNSNHVAGKIETAQRLMNKLSSLGQESITFFSRWGPSTVEVVQQLEKRIQPAKLSAVISLQDFILGGGDGRVTVTDELKKLNVPVIKGIRIHELTESEWRLSSDGLPWKSVHYRISMPEIQGISQPIVLSVSEKPIIDELTGCKVSFNKPIENRIDALTKRIANWSQLQNKENKYKKIAIIYYNHPPGRHNIGADNLDVPKSLMSILNHLKKNGYNTGKLPSNSEELLDRILKEAINLPEDYTALSEYSEKSTILSKDHYKKWFKGLPQAIQLEMEQGPLGFLDGIIRKAVEHKEIDIGLKSIYRIIHDLEHMVEDIQHPSKQRTLNLIEQLEELYIKSLHGNPNWKEAKTLIQAITSSGIEGLTGWGKAPGTVMVHKDKMIIPGIHYGNIFIAPQPPRGWEVKEEILHANMAIPPHHQYLGFYHYIKDIFKADAIIHLGRHSTYEFLPRHRAGLTEKDYPTIIAGNTPGIYPYIVDGIGEGIQAKRRGLAVMISHLTPPLRSTPLYEDLLELRQLVENFEASNPEGETVAQRRRFDEIKRLVIQLNLQEEIVAELIKEHHLDSKTQFEDLDDDMLIHEIGHYLTDVQERFMPLGLHVFGKNWQEDALALMIESMESAPGSDADKNLRASPKAELDAFINGLQGGFIQPGKGNDPIRTVESLPTGRNFYALDSSLLPTKIAWGIGEDLAKKAKLQKNDPQESAAIVLWASDAVRDHGAMIAFGLDLLGVKPKWNRRGIVNGLERIPLDEERTYRKDVVFSISGLFRDLYGQQVNLLDQAVLMALDASSLKIQSQYPHLSHCLDEALKQLKDKRDPGNEPLDQNYIAAHWVQEIEALKNPTTERIKKSTLRIFGTPPGSYGAGINRLVERSGSWQSREDVFNVYLRGMGHAYGIEKEGDPAYKSFERRLHQIGETYLGRSSHLYGLLDNNDAFDFQGGLSLAIEQIRGKVPENYVIRHADPKNLKIDSLQSSILQELRGRFLNPAWLQPLMGHDYAGARTMGSEFLEYLWGWQVTNPEIIKSWVWDEVNAVYFEDKHQIQLDQFLETGNNVHVKINMEAIFLVAAHKEFWDTDEETLHNLANKFASKVIEHGLPGSGHTRPDHPMFEWILPKLDPKLKQNLIEVLKKAQAPIEKPIDQTLTTVSEIKIKESNKQPDKESEAVSDQEIETQPAKLFFNQHPLWILGIATILIGIGYYTGRYKK